MVQVIVNMEVKDNQVSEFIGVFKELAEATRKETGCINYEMYQDEASSSSFFILEQWASKANLDAHIESEHFKRLFPIMSTQTTKEPKITLCSKVA